ncbi:hypothetical protein J2Y63_006826 [Shinella sp. BE166]
MTKKINLMSLCLLATFIVIFGSVLSMTLFSAGSQPTIATVDALARQD